MDFFDVLSMIGGLCMFLYGMRLMGDSIKRDTSGTVKSFMGRITNNNFNAFLLGLFVTALIQSSTATIVIIAGLVTAGIVTLKQSLGVIIGANVGTTVTGQIIRLLDINSNSTNFIKIFQPSSLAPIALFIGILCLMFLNFKNHNLIGSVFMGFGVLFSGLLTMTSSVSVLSESGALEPMFDFINENTWFAFFLGIVISVALQSASASIGILQTFATASVITFYMSYMVILGIFIGSCFTTAMLCSIGTSTDARRVGLVNALFNIGKVILILIVVNALHLLGLISSYWDTAMTSGSIANINTIFNLLCALALLPFVGLFEKLSRIFIKDKPAAVGKYAEEIKVLNPVFFSAPSIALNGCYNLLKIMLDSACENVIKAISLLYEFDQKTANTIGEEENNIDSLTDKVCSYMTQLSPHINDNEQMRILFEYNKLVTNYERLSDHAMNVLEIAEEIHNSESGLSQDALKEIGVLEDIISQLFECAKQAFRYNDLQAAHKIEPLEEVTDDLVNAMHDHHLRRLHQGICTTKTGIAFMDLLSNLERISDICSNIGVAIITRATPELASLAHTYVSTIHKSNDKEYQEIYQKSHDKYFTELGENYTNNYSAIS